MKKPPKELQPDSRLEPPFRPDGPDDGDLKHPFRPEGPDHNDLEHPLVRTVRQPGGRVLFLRGKFRQPIKGACWAAGILIKESALILGF